MASPILIDQFHVKMTAPRGLPTRVYDAISRALDRPDFRAELGRAVRAVLRARPALRTARATVSR